MQEESILKFLHGIIKLMCIRQVVFDEGYIMKKFLQILFTPQSKKIDYLRKKFFDYHYTIYQVKLFDSNSNGVRIPDFILENRVNSYATKAAEEDIAKIVSENKVSEYFAKALLPIPVVDNQPSSL